MSAIPAAFAPPVAPFTQARRPAPVSRLSPPRAQADAAPASSSRLMHVRLRLHLLQLSHHQRRHHHDPPSALSSPQLDPDDSPLHHPDDSLPLPVSLAASADDSSAPKTSYSDEERKARSDRLRSLWKDKDWRANMLARRASREVTSRRSESLKRVWQDDAYRERMRKSRTGRDAPNKGVPASAVTRLRMSVAKKGVKLSEETKHRMSVAKRSKKKDDEWSKLIGESKKGKTKEYYALRREFRALHKDLKLWSDSFRARYGRLPNAQTFERFVAPMMILRIRRYLTLRDAIGEDDVEVKSDIFQKE